MLLQLNKTEYVLFFIPRQGEEAPLVRDEGEDLFVIEQSSYDFLEMKKAEYVGYKRLVQRESEILFKPSFRSGKLLF